MDTYQTGAQKRLDKQERREYVDRIDDERARRIAAEAELLEAATRNRNEKAGLENDMSDERAHADRLADALRAVCADYKQLADSGDAGFWTFEELECGKLANTALADHDARRKEGR